MGPYNKTFTSGPYNKATNTIGGNDNTRPSGKAWSNYETAERDGSYPLSPYHPLYEQIQESKKLGK